MLKEVVYKENKVYVTTGLRGLQIFDVSNLYFACPDWSLFRQNYANGSSDR
ncbi:MAG: hypothetical protein U5J96_14710 [Ignavibacteriaceae bacterium]|nr:hypothetical protein [Ignavibacteriaceae bacterium]